MKLEKRKKTQSRQGVKDMTSKQRKSKMGGIIRKLLILLISLVIICIAQKSRKSQAKTRNWFLKEILLIKPENKI